jgi:arylformamidase
MAYATQLSQINTKPCGSNQVRTMRLIYLLALPVIAGLCVVTAVSAATKVNRPLQFSYGDNSEQTLDVYASKDAHQAPVIFMVHGGAWRFGDKDNKRVVTNKVARWLPQGYVFISINYRMLPDLNGLQQADDVARALAYAQSHAGDWGGDPNRFILMGHSAGAHLVALLNAAPAKAYAFGAKPWLGTVALDSAAYDIPAVMAQKHYRFYDKAFGLYRETWEQASPHYAITGEARPMLAVCSTKRPDRPCDQVHAFASKAKSLSVNVQTLEQPLSHKEINEQLGLPSAYTDTVEHFMKSLQSGS